MKTNNEVPAYNGKPLYYLETKRPPELTEYQTLRLTIPFHPLKLSWRIGSKSKGNATVLAYIDARDVQDRLDDAVGNGNWKNEYFFHGSRVLCRLSIKIGSEWISKEDGAGDTHIEGEKGGLSDAFKRAAVHWGINRDAYALPTTWAKLTDKGYLPKDINAQMASKMPNWYLKKYKEIADRLKELTTNDED